MAAIAIVVALAAAACAFGLRLLRPTPQLQLASFLERAVFGASVGLGATSYLVLAVGLAGALYPWVIIALLVALAAVSWRDLGNLLAGVARGVRSFFAGPASVGAAAATGFLLIMLLLAILGALAPSSANDWDGLSYHLAVAKLYTQAHRIYYIGWLSHSNFPFTLEMLYAAGLALDGQAAAKLFHTLSAILLALAMVAFGGAHWERRHGALAAVIFLAAPVVAWEATAGLNDLATGLFTLLSLYAFINWWSERGAGWLTLSAVLCGLAIGVKMTALVLLAFLVVAAFYHRAATQRQGIGTAIRTAAIFLAIAAAVGSPWYVRSYLWTGNPVYPFFYNLFDGKYWTAEAARFYRQEQLGFGMGHGPLALLLLPWNLTMYAHMFSNFPQRPLLYTSISPLLLALLPGLLFLGKLDRRVKFLLIYSLVALLAWFELSQQLRYAIPTLPALSLCAGFAGSELLRRAQKELRAIVVIALALVGVVSLSIQGLLVADGIPVILGRESQAAYLTRTLDGLYSMAAVINELPPGSKVIMYGETRGLYFDTPYMWGNHHHNMIQYERLAVGRPTGGRAGLMRVYRKLGVTDVLMTGYFLEAVKTRQSDLGELLDDALQQRMLVPVAARGNLILLRVTEPDA